MAEPIYLNICHKLSSHMQLVPGSCSRSGHWPSNLLITILSITTRVFCSSSLFSSTCFYWSSSFLRRSRSTGAAASTGVAVPTWSSMESSCSMMSAPCWRCSVIQLVKGICPYAYILSSTQISFLEQWRCPRGI